MCSAVTKPKRTIRNFVIAPPPAPLHCWQVGCIKGSSQVEPTVVGKPAAFMLDYIADKFDLRRDQICMVGDRLDTDILFGAFLGVCELR
jgi:ribonucleotide monophosphatase NagD (HAD superfamily)